MTQDLFDHGRADFKAALGIEIHFVDRAARREYREPDWFSVRHFKAGRSAARSRTAGSITRVDELAASHDFHL
jgi:hypothetical protein